ncbi:hypothetical protein [Bacillus alveayuensis]|jgi:hypothetical protein|uniref:hypothetical protein n=1 Tax=Aeribacillus alveayuensis TaxID=279215 RepID=UPI0005D127D4|nr:hypothetical protein [Bacillus alveayuensis]
MLQFTFVMSVVVFLIAVVGLIYTYSLGRKQKLQGEYDTEINEKVQEHPYLRNPVFLTYIIAAGLAVISIIYFALNYEW